MVLKIQNFNLGSGSPIHIFRIVPTLAANSAPLNTPTILLLAFRPYQLSSKTILFKYCIHLSTYFRLKLNIFALQSLVKQEPAEVDSDVELMSWDPDSGFESPTYDSPTPPRVNARQEVRKGGRADPSYEPPPRKHTQVI